MPITASFIALFHFMKLFFYELSKSDRQAQGPNKDGDGYYRQNGYFFQRSLSERIRSMIFALHCLNMEFTFHVPEVFCVIFCLFDYLLTHVKSLNKTKAATLQNMRIISINNRHKMALI